MVTHVGFNPRQAAEAPKKEGGMLKRNRDVTGVSSPQMGSHAAAFWRPHSLERPRPQPPPPALTRQHLEATTAYAPSARHRVVNDNSQTTDLIFCKKKKIIRRCHVGGGVHTHAHTLTHAQWKLSLSP